MDDAVGGPADCRTCRTQKSTGAGLSRTYPLGVGEPANRTPYAVTRRTFTFKMSGIPRAGPLAQW